MGSTKQSDLSDRNKSLDDEDHLHLHHQATPADPTKYTILQVNGCRSNRALDFADPEPETTCELYVKNIPRRFKGEDLWPLFERYGRIYNIRVLMDYNDFNRGFAYVKFSKESEALLAMELMNHFFVFPGYRLNILRSTSKSRLFANYVPREVPVSVVQEKFKEIFKGMRELIMPPSKSYEPGANHRGIAFLEFRTHQEAVAAKKTVYSGVLEIWGAKVKISWARPLETYTGYEDDREDFYPRLFIKPFEQGTRAQAFLDFVDEKINVLDKVVGFCVKKTIGIMKVLTVRDGEEIMRQLNGKEFCGHRLHLSWYRERNTMERRYCFCKSLELMCTANCWATPVILFGRIFPKRCEQYVALFTSFRGNVFSVFAKVALNDRLDMTSRISEVFLALIEDTGYLPSYNYVVEVEENNARVIGFVQSTMEFTRSYKAGDANYSFYWEEMMELNWAVQKLARIHPQYLYKKYHDAIDNAIESTDGHDQYLVEGIETNNRVLSSVYNDQTNMTLFLLCDKVTKSNKYFTGKEPASFSTFHATTCYGKHPQHFQLSALDWIKKEP